MLTNRKPKLMKKAVIFFALTILLAYSFKSPSLVVADKISNHPVAESNHAKLMDDIKNKSSKRSHKTVLLDYYFNNEWRKDRAGNNARFHYTWEDSTNSGYRVLGEIFRSQGFATKSLETEPTKKNLKKAGIYIVVDPDNEKETANPHIISTHDADVISNWVKDGGVLLLMANDSGNTNLKSMNVLSTRFGIRFNEDLFNPVIGSQYEQGAIIIPEGNSIFTPKKIYIKELATLDVSDPAKTILTKNGKNIVAVAKYGKGTVFALGDPWVYNEYTNGKLPAGFENRAAAEEFVRWAIAQTNN
jgi:unsaturated rhamnogalacturonyl hydrolase